MPRNSRKLHAPIKATRLLDNIGRKIICELQKDARIPFAELGRRVGLSTPAVAERVHKLEDAGVITRYSAEVDPEKLGYPISAFIGVHAVGDFLQRITKVSRETPQILECHRVTGANSFIMKVAVASVDQLQVLIDSLTPVETTTSVVLSAVVTTRIIEPRTLENTP